MEAAIRFSQNSFPADPQRFLYVDVVGRSFKLCNVTKQSKRVFEYEAIHTTTKVPAFRAFDWHPVNEDLVVVGQAGGEATLLNIAEGQQDSLAFQVRSQRLCNAVALNSQNLLAAGLDKVRTDFCLNIWDFNQGLPTAGSMGFSKNHSEPLHKLASGEPITSLKFFQDDPSLLVAGVKGQFVRLYDLREPSIGNGLQFATRCVHNLAIDWLDQNYFASCYPTNDPSICVWDRRMISRLNTPQMGFTGGSHSENRQPELSLELKSVVESPGTVWSVRFSKAERGCLGVLSSTGHLKVYKLGKDFSSQTYRVENDGRQDLSWETSTPQEIFLERAQDLERPYASAAAPKNEKPRVVSFDFTTATTNMRQSKILTLDGRGEVKLISPSPPPGPSPLCSAGYLCKGSHFIEQVTTSTPEPGTAIDQVRRRAQPRNILRQTFKQSRQNKTIAETKRMSSLDDQAWHADLGFYERDVPLADLVTLTSIQRLRCEAGYLLNPSQNKAIVSDSHWLQSFWAWVERAAKISRNGNMAHDNFDLSYIGVYGLWMEDIDPKHRMLGQSPNTLGKTIENLVHRLNIPGISKMTTEYTANRQLCLYSAGLAWSSDELKSIVKRLVMKNQHTKAAALALFAMDRKLAYKALRDKTANQSHKMLAMAIAGSFKKARNEDAGASSPGESDAQDDWADTISSLADELTDPYARAILAYVKTGDWSNVVAEESLPLKYRVCIALRHYDDSRLTKYISDTTKEALAAGDIEGVVLTGTATQAAFDLMSGYVQRFGDLQTAVLALCSTIPRYLDDETVLRKFNGWKDAYRHMMNSWNLKFDRVRFDIACHNAARDEGGRPLIPPAKQQVRLVCSFCAQSIAHLAGADGENVSGHKVMDTARHPLTKEKAAAVGIVCPKCERHLPRCGVCDLWLGEPDGSYLPWYGSQSLSKHDAGKASLDLSASVAGSVQTTLGPDTTLGPNIKGSSPRQKHSVPVNSKVSTSESSTKTTVPTSPAPNKTVDSVPEIMVAAPEGSGHGQGPDGEMKKVEAARKWDSTMSRFTTASIMMATRTRISMNVASARNGVGYFFAIVFVALSLLAVYMLRVASIMSGVADKMEYITTNSQFTEHSMELRTTYTGIAPLDKGLSFLVAAFMNGAAGWDRGFLVFMMYFLFSFFPIVSIWAIESCRERNGLALTRFIYALFYQTVGGAIIIPIYYLAYLYDTSSNQYWAKIRRVPLPYAKALPPAVIIGYLIPTVLMFLPYSTAHNLWTTQAMVAFWQPCPWYVNALLWLLPTFYSGRRAASQPSNAQAHQTTKPKPDYAPGHDDVKYLNRVYLVSFAVAALSHVAVAVTCLVSSDPEHSFQHMFLPPSSSTSSSSTMAESDTQQLSLVQGMHAIFQADYWIIFVASLVWAYLAIWDLKRLGLTRDVNLATALLAMLLGCVLVGPAATVAMVWWWREGVLVAAERA
ncbi:hypothetical protein AYO20_00513 [Fonsecaea nubica]|uniref:Uncharacterized protein n=1 Tax=Fonsecaea nubica TaxID=856822 RepID=A0A178DGB5_9EURO|nr:hypothetical protein AYO20_00513 [Fonsecaea nubica]OAL40095.1 hypothetical protein AYO20_00513 [Fonsecaea nubica]